ncbi:SWIM zinc finger family protein [Metabacillus sp. KIGAM252]|uniref:SWIM zinc finger family protein n=1 Tax=Metabacillus flavus TaxID=2823519 RepID=A0ABS5LAY9_9BACI|nr:SWIM zinc finger family protein [Metabacillus flavus]MBS2967875.1 SWIM zinc finger family protein [Metabacillus flavus]
MYLADFEDFINETILKRGKDYYKKGQILKLREVDGMHKAVVEGSSYPYHVNVKMAGGTVLETYCDCPFDGLYCKHEAAVLFALRDGMVEREPEESKSKKKETAIEDLLPQMKKEDLVRVLIDLSETYPEIEKKLLFEFAPIEDEVAASKKMIREYIRKAKKQGFISYGRVDQALYGAVLTLEKAQIKRDAGQPESTVLLSLAVMSIVIEMLQYTDDSSGSIGSVLFTAVNLIDEAVEEGLGQWPEAKQKELLKAILKEAMHARYDDWSERVDLLRICVQFAVDPELRKELEKTLLKRLRELNGEDYGGRYEEESIMGFLLELYESADLEEAEAFLKANLSYPSFREIAINRSMESGDYQQAISLCEEGIHAKKERQGNIIKWKKLEYKAYELLGDREKQKELARKLISGQEGIHYYLKLKELYDPEEWPAVLEELLTELYPSSPYNPYLEILKIENQKDKILEYCRASTSEIVRLHPYIQGEYPEEVNDIFAQHIRNESSRASNRNQYKKVTKLFEPYKKACGESSARGLAEDLKKEYHYRPAMVEELENV